VRADGYSGGLIIALTVKGVDHHFSLSRDFQSQEALAPPPNGSSGPDPLGLSTSMEGPGGRERRGWVPDIPRPHGAEKVGGVRVRAFLTFR